MGLDIEVIKEDNFKLSQIYENSLDIITKQNKGIYYTPKFIVDYIVEKTLKNHDIVENPYPKVLDISCGCGNFLLEVYDILYDLIEKNLYELKEKYNEDYWNNDNIHNHIITNCIYGADIDKDALKILKNSLIKKDEDLKVEKFNLYCCDSLEYKWQYKFDYIIGNPPYIGHKKLDNDYKKFIAKNYAEVYKDKSDLYYCFYKKIIELLNNNGISSIITPRYFLESPSGRHLRNYIIKNTNIEEIVDFLGVPIFKNVGVCSCIVTFNNQAKNNNIKVFKVINENIKLENIEKLKKIINSDEFEKITINKKELNEDWLLINKSDKIFLNKLESKCNYSLQEIAISFQGIISGCDRAFIINKNDKIVKNINEKLLKNWIKNKNISKYIVNKSDSKLIYSNDIKDEERYPFEINEIIGIYKDKLLNRRECRKNSRKWYELQWGREKYLFEQKKIMYPYKCKENRFAIDEENNYCSADVYSFYLKEEYTTEFSYEYLVGILNSSTYDKYFKIIAKKISKNTYDYYPNKVMKIKIFKDSNYKEIESICTEMINYIKQNPNKDEKYIKNLQNKIDKLIIQSLFL